MRLLRELDGATAARLVDALADQGIESEQKPAGEAQGVWVLDEAHMARAEELARSWLDVASRDAFDEAASRGRRAREIDRRIEERRQRHVEVLARKLQAAARPRSTPLTWGLIALCGMVFLLTQGSEVASVAAELSIVDPRAPQRVTFVPVLGRALPWLSLPWREPWRLVTPALLHFHPLHLAMNMFALHWLGRIVERAHGSRYLALFVVVSATISNIAQFEITQRPNFAGTSGVVYGLFGLIWLRGKLDPWVGYGLSKSAMELMVICLALGFLGNFGIANYCHLFGLLVGLAWAAVANKLKRS